MDISELRGTVLQRFQELTDSEIGIMQSMEEHPIGEVVMKLLGPELVEIFSDPESETDRMLADDMPQDMPREMYERAPIQMFADDPNNPSAERMDPDDPRLKRPRPEETDPMMEREMVSR